MPPFLPPLLENVMNEPPMPPNPLFMAFQDPVVIARYVARLRAEINRERRSRRENPQIEQLAAVLDDLEEIAIEERDFLDPVVEIEQVVEVMDAVMVRLPPHLVEQTRPRAIEQIGNYIDEVYHHPERDEERPPRVEHQNELDEQREMVRTTIPILERMLRFYQTRPIRRRLNLDTLERLIEKAKQEMGLEEIQQWQEDVLTWQQGVTEFLQNRDHGFFEPL